MKLNELVKLVIMVITLMGLISCEKEEPFSMVEKTYVTSNKENTAIDSVSRSSVNITNNYSYVECNLTIKGVLKINGSYIDKDIPSLKINVSSIRVEVTVDDDNTNIISYNPKPAENIIENSTVWNELPEGINWKDKNLFNKPILIIYHNNYKVKVAVNYTVRVRDSKLAAGCTVDHSYKVMNFTSQGKTENTIFTFPIELTSVDFDAGVADYE